MDTQIDVNKKLRRNVGLQTYIYTKEYLNPKMAVSHNLEHSEFGYIFAIPHSITILLVLGVFLFTYGGSSLDPQQSIKLGSLGVTLTVMVFGTIYLPDTVLKRPHPMFWRFILTCSLMYLMFLVFMLFQTIDQARQIMIYFDEDLGKPLQVVIFDFKTCPLNEQPYTETFPYFDYLRVWSRVDFYAACHFFGWLLRMAFIRNTTVAWVMSCLWEIMELTIGHNVSNLYECWWDSLFLDVLCFNALGIYVGSKVVKFFEKKNKVFSKRANWAIFRYLKYCVPNVLVSHEWNPFSSFARFICTLWIIVLLTSVEVSHFFLKDILWIPQTHFILKYRLILWLWIGNVGVREYYEYITQSSFRFGAHAYVAHCIIFVEYSIIYKFHEGILKNPTPLGVYIFWSIAAIVLFTISTTLIIKDTLAYFFKKEKPMKKNPLEPSIDIEYVEHGTNTSE